METGKTDGDVNPRATSSLGRLCELINLGVLTIQEVRATYIKVIAPHLELIGFESNKHRCTIFSHAPALLQSVFYAAKGFEIDLHADLEPLDNFMNNVSREQLSAIIADINNEVTRLAKVGKLHEAYPFLMTVSKPRNVIRSTIPAQLFVAQLIWTFNLPLADYQRSAAAQDRLNMMAVHGHNSRDHAQVIAVDGNNAPRTIPASTRLTHIGTDTPVCKNRAACLKLHKSELRNGTQGLLLVYVSQGMPLAFDKTGTYCHVEHHSRANWASAGLSSAYHISTWQLNPSQLEIVRKKPVCFAHLMFYAAQHGNAPLVQQLVQMGVSASQKTHCAQPHPKYSAISLGHNISVNDFIRSGACTQEVVKAATIRLPLPRIAASRVTVGGRATARTTTQAYAVAKQRPNVPAQPQEGGKGNPSIHPTSDFQR
jgi:hypothetical protein